MAGALGKTFSLTRRHRQRIGAGVSPRFSYVPKVLITLLQAAR